MSSLTTSFYILLGFLVNVVRPVLKEELRQSCFKGISVYLQSLKELKKFSDANMQL